MTVSVSNDLRRTGCPPANGDATTDIAPPPASAETAGTIMAEPQQPRDADGDQWDLVIKPRTGWIGIDWAELVSHRELLCFLVWRDVKVKYKQAVLGFAWAIIVPVISVILFTVIGRAAGWQSKFNGPYPVYVYAGLLPWLFLATSINNGGMSLVNQQSLISKIYLPRLFMPLSTIGVALVDMAISFVVFLGMMAIYKYPPSWQLLTLPLLLLLATVVGTGFAVMLSALTVTWRDVRFLIGFFSQILMWLSGAVYPPRIFGSHERLLAVNPAYGVISGFRSAILGEQWHFGALAIAAVEGVALLVFGLFYFKRAERRFADIA